MNQKKAFAIKDFSPVLQPYLTKAVSKGVVGFDTNTKFIKHNTSDLELIELSQSEHPILRAIAFVELLNRNSIDHFHLIMENLGDSAIVPFDYGEFGLKLRRVSDYILENGRWKDTSSKMETIELLVSKYNYLRGAYIMANKVSPDERFYESIKEMAVRQIGGYGEIRFLQIEYALHALAKYKKKEDIEIIKGILDRHLTSLSDESFELMAEYPNDAYMDIYEHYFKWHFYREMCEEIRGVLDCVAFIKSIAVYKNDRSKEILSYIFHHNPGKGCKGDMNFVRSTLIDAIWENPCESYSQLRDETKGLYEPYKRNAPEIALSNDSSIKIQVKKEPIGWWE